MRFFSVKEIVIFVCIVVAVIFGVIHEKDQTLTEGGIICIAITAIIYLLMFLYRKHVKFRCKNCKTSGTVVKCDIVFVRTETLRRLEKYGRDGKPLNVPYYIYGTKNVYNECYRCSKCGATYKKEISESKWDDE